MNNGFNRIFLGLALVLALSGGVAYASVTDTNVYTPANYTTFLPPVLGASYTDASFGTSIKRISSAVLQRSADTGAFFSFITHEYSSMSPFNNDNSRVLGLHQSYFALYDGSGTFLKDCPLQINASSEPRWSRADSNVLYFINGNQLKQYNAATDAISVVHTFSEYSAISGKGESDISFDGDHFVLVGDNRYIFVFEVSTKVKGAVLDSAGRGFDSVYITPNNNVTVTWLQAGTARYTGIELFDRNMAFQRQVSRAGGHMDVARDVNGDEVLLLINSADPTPIANNAVVKIRLSDGLQTSLVSLDWSLAVHISAGDNNGWVYVSTYDPTNPTPQSGWKRYTNEIIQVKLDGSEIRRLAHHRSRKADTYNYTPRVSASRDGSRLIYSSNYGLQAISGGYSNEYVDLYLIKFPSANSGGSPDNSGIESVTVNLQTSKTTYLRDETIKATELQLRNPGSVAIPIELKIWLTIPGMAPLTALNMGSDGTLILSVGSEQNLGPLTFFSATGMPSGNYELSSRLLDPTTAKLLSEDLNSFFLGETLQAAVIQLTAVETPPVLTVTMSKNSYINGETVTVTELRLRNSATTSRGVEFKAWLTTPGAAPVPVINMGADQSLVLSSNFDHNVGPLSLFTVTSTKARGTYEFSSRLVDPVTGKLLSEDVNSFVIQ